MAIHYFFYLCNYFLSLQSESDYFDILTLILVVQNDLDTVGENKEEHEVRCAHKINEEEL